MRTVTVTMPLPPNLANWRAHWAVKQRQKRAWEQRAIVSDRALRGRHRPMRRVRVSVILHVRQLMDDDNAVARLKWCLDLLKKRGLIVDDKRPHLELAGIPEQRPRSKPPRVVLVLEELAA